MKKHSHILISALTAFSVTILFGCIMLLIYAKLSGNSPSSLFSHDDEDKNTVASMDIIGQGTLSSSKDNGSDGVESSTTGKTSGNENVSSRATENAVTSAVAETTGRADMTGSADAEMMNSAGMTDTAGSEGLTDYNTGISGTDHESINEENGSFDNDELSAGVTGDKAPVTLVFTGDICFHDPFANMGAFRQRGSAISNCIDASLLSEMTGADICMVNNEFPYSNRGTPTEGKTYAFRSKPENVHILSDMGIDIVTLANNHAFDHGETAFLDTLDILDGEGILHVGGGKNITEAASPVIMEKGGMKIGFLGATQIERMTNPDTRGATDTLPGVMRCFSENELARFLEAIQTTDKMCDFLVVFVHWGSENTDVLDERQTSQAAAFAKAGADLVVGCHSHCLQGLGQNDGVPVIYSLGNYWFNSKTVDTALLKVIVEDSKINSLQMIAAKQENCKTTHMEGSEKDRIINYLNSISRDGVSLDADGFLHGF